MTESRFLSFVLTEGLLLLFLGFGMLILPKVSMVSFGYMMFLSFIIYGGYKSISAVLTKNFSKHFILDITVGLLLFANGILLYFLQAVNMMIIVGLAGVYFVLKSISSFSFTVQTRKTLNFWWMCIFLALLEMFVGLCVIIMLPSAAIWLIGILTGLDFILSGVVLMNMYISTNYMK